ncbi:Peroxisomal membrane protein, putative [Perkinsus marinus ATCC 50983]|uniref:Peroxisomal membrane protein, putative n=1 Tax=Perkinsus marinus (strain ATCC 50983 / TXsc) TaxID=423536 RepID=C5LU21_PERM5|nr:Peroxisomal membrane protein, putative [Perkinsus marinus ATCC 50983]EEQ99819.1 Peroxisomal membrane protein, putative [Perkinsus marinus ATCC 50983]|eukprot:XP_002767102.1 Peroxisomal membrane protein, putative [Perkinsus marinus ATCC 50983]
MGSNTEPGFSRLLEQYREASEAMPLTVQCIQGPILIIIADILAQFITGARTIDKRRCIRVALCQLVVFGPMTYFWYDVLLPSWGEYLPTTAHKVLVDQTLWCWTFLSTFFFIQSLAAGKSVAASVKAVQSNLGPALKANYCFWPMMQ